MKQVCQNDQVNLSEEKISTWGDRMIIRCADNCVIEPEQIKVFFRCQKEKLEAVFDKALYSESDWRNLIDMAMDRQEILKKFEDEMIKRLGC